MAKKILITGGCGFIGTNLIAGLGTGVSIRVLDNLAKGPWSPVLQNPSVEIVRGDIRDEQIVDASLRGIDAVIHLAAYGSVMESIADPLPNFEVNVRGTVNLLNACVKRGIQKFVFASTGGAAIGEFSGRVSEMIPARPVSPYGASKVACEAYCHAFSKSAGLRTLCLRFGNIYGPFSWHKGGAITQFMRSILDNRPIRIYGDGSATRDYLYVDDLCIGIIKALEADFEPGLVVHLATGIETSIQQLLGEILTVANRTGHPVEYLQKRRGEIEHNVASYERAQHLFGFAPVISVRDGILRTWQWFQKHHGS